MSHWMMVVAEKAGFDGVETLDLSPSDAVEHVWARTCEACGVTPDALARAVAVAFRSDVADLDGAEPMATKLVPGSIARRFGVFPVRDGDRFLVVATANPTDPEAEQQIGFVSGRTPLLAIAPPTAISDAIDRSYSPEVAAASLLRNVGADARDIVDVEIEGDTVPEEISEADAGAGPIVRLTNLILHEAVVRGASDIHIQPKGALGLVRLRLDGILQDGMEMPMSVLTRVVSRIKVMGDLDIADRLRPQDGRARILVDGRKYDLRVSTVPTRQAEKAVIRILDTHGHGTLEDTGIQAGDVARIREVLSNRDGIFVVTGPTGSGKTTTLYSALGEISTEDVNIMTVEDPVEYELPGLTQLQVEVKQGVTFASALRAILRQDPDVIFVGEIRDAETAEIAAQASLTGHLVLATLHTNDAVGSIRRFLDLGLDAATVSETLRGVLAQRLVRRVCPHCVAPVTEPLTPAEQSLRQRFGREPKVRPVGCERCVGQGYLGRLPVTEFLATSPELVRLIMDGAPTFEIEAQAVRDGMKSLLASALERANAGETTLAEVERVVGSADAARTASAGPAVLGSPTEAGSPTVGVGASATDERVGAAPDEDVAPSATADDEDEDEDEVGTGGDGDRPSVLIVDDDGTGRQVARALLEKEGYRVTEASDGSEALARLAKGERYSLMVLDLDMPMLGGREVLRAVRRSLSTATLPIVVLTGTTDPDADIELLEQGADDYIRKPLDPRRFVTRVAATLRRASA